jgi:hypothetical protein
MKRINIALSVAVTTILCFAYIKSREAIASQNTETSLTEDIEVFRMGNSKREGRIVTHEIDGVTYKVFGYGEGIFVVNHTKEVLEIQKLKEVSE